MESESIVHISHRSDPPLLRFLHFNDVYHIEEGSAEPIGGITRFQTLINHYRSSAPSPITLFSGDAFNPSLESSVTKGRHMVPILNGIGVDVACVGNHDLDFGVPQFRYLKEKSEFPWLLANVLDPALGEDVPLGGCQKSVVLEKQGVKIGIIGFGEREWLDTINSLPPNLVYKSASATARELIPPLRAQGCSMIIALTHAREPSDIKLARGVPPGMIDLIVGGHDHFYAHRIENKVHILRSGTDFKQLSYLEARRREGTIGNDTKWDFDITRRDVVRSIPEDPQTIKLVKDLTSSLKSKLEKIIGYTAVPLDARFTTVRTRESNIGNFVCDLMKFYHSTDCAIMAGGTIRGDQIYPPGVLRLKDILNCFPFEDPVVVVRVTGKAIWDALENGIELLPALEGRFPQVSGIQFEFDPQAKVDRRILWVKINEESLDFGKTYTLATRGYMGRGKDGFDSLLVKSEGGTAEEIVSEEHGVLISMILRQYFMSLKVLGRWRRWGTALTEQWSDVHDGMSKDGGIRPPSPVVQRVHKQKCNTNRNNPKRSSEQEPDKDLVDSDTDGEEEHIHDSYSSERDDLSEKEKPVARDYAHRWMLLAGVKPHQIGMVGEHEDHHIPHWTRGIAPKLENRIIIHNDRSPLMRAA